MLPNKNNKKSLPGLKYAFIHCLLSNLTDSEIENNLLNTFYTKFLELDALNAKVKINRTSMTRSYSSSNSLSNISIGSESDSDSSPPATPRKTNLRTSSPSQATPKKQILPRYLPGTPTRRDIAYSAVIDEFANSLVPKRLNFNSPNLTASKKKKVVAVTNESEELFDLEKETIISTQEVLDRLNAILELKTETKSKAAKNKLLDLIQYLLNLLSDEKKSLPPELILCIDDFFYRLNTAGEQFFQLTQFKDHAKKLKFSYEKALTKNKGPAAEVEQKVKTKLKQIFTEINTAFYIGGVIDNLYFLKESSSEESDKKIIDFIINKFLSDEDQKEKNYEYYNEIFHENIDPRLNNKNTINKELLTVLIEHFIRLQSYNTKETDWRYFKYLWLSECLKKNTIDKALANCHNLKALIDYAIDTIKRFRQKNPAPDFDKQSIRIANAVLRLALVDDSIPQDKKDKILALNEKDISAENRYISIKQKYSNFYHKSSAHYLYPSDMQIEEFQIDYIKEIATKKLKLYIKDRKNSIFYSPYDLVNRGHLGIDNQTNRLNKAREVKQAVDQINSFTSFTDLIKTFAFKITRIHDHTSWLKAELRSLSYRMFTVLDKAAAYNNDAKQAKYAILTNILNPCIAEIFGTTDENAYPTQRKTLRITDSFSGFITKLKFKLANILDSSQYREESIQEFHYIYNIHFQLQQLSNLDQEKDEFEAEVTESYTNLFELLAHAANNIHNSDLTDKINSVRNVLLRMFRPLHNPKISTVRLPFTDAQRQRIKDSLDNNRQNSYDSKKLQSMLVNPEANLGEFKEALAVKLHSHFLAKVVLSTGEVARTQNSVDIVTQGLTAAGTAACLAAGAPHAVYSVTTLTELGMSQYNQYMREQYAEFAYNAADETHRKMLVNLIVDKVIYRYHHQIANLIHPIDIKKLAGYFAERILFQPQNAKNLHAAANEYVDNIMKFPKIHGIFFDDTVVSQNSSPLEISELCTKPNVAIHVSGFSDDTSVDKIQFYGRVTKKLNYAEEYGYVYETSEFQLKVLKEDEALEANFSNTYFLRKTKKSYELFYLSERIQLVDVHGLKQHLTEDLDTKEILKCLATYHGKKSVRNLNVSENNMQEVKLSKTSKKTETRIVDGETRVGQLEAVRFFHNKRTERDHQEQDATTSLRQPNTQIYSP